MVLRSETIQKFRSIPDFDDFIVALYDWVEGNSYDYQGIFSAKCGLCTNFTYFRLYHKLDCAVKLSHVFNQIYGTIYPFNKNIEEYVEESVRRFGIFSNKEREAFIEEMYNAVMADRRISQECD